MRPIISYRVVHRQETPEERARKLSEERRRQAQAQLNTMRDEEWAEHMSQEAIAVGGLQLRRPTLLDREFQDGRGFVNRAALATAGERWNGRIRALIAKIKAVKGVRWNQDWLYTGHFTVTFRHFAKAA